MHAGAYAKYLRRNKGINLFIIKKIYLSFSSTISSSLLVEVNPYFNFPGHQIFVYSLINFFDYEFPEVNYYLSFQHICNLGTAKA